MAITLPPPRDPPRPKTPQMTIKYGGAAEPGAAASAIREAGGLAPFSRLTGEFFHRFHLSCSAGRFKLNTV